MVEQKKSDPDTETTKHVENRMSDIEKILKMASNGVERRTIANRLHVAESYVDYVLEVDDYDKMLEEVLKSYETPERLHNIIREAKGKIAAVKAATEKTTTESAKPTVEVPIAKPKKEKPAKTESKPAKSEGVMNSRNVAILEILKSNPAGMTMEVIGAAVNAKLGINRASWNTPMYELKKAGLVEYNKENKIYTTK